MRILFMGTPDFSVPTLKTLIESEHEVIGVVSQPDRAKGRGKQLQMTPVKEMALAHNIPVYQPLKVRDPEFIEMMTSLDIDVAVVIAFGQILPKAFLEIPKRGCMNVHASLLPNYRGAGPIQRAIINGEPKTGVTTMMMDIGMDTGDMLLREEVTIAPDETGGSLFEKLSHIGGPLMLKTLEALEAGTLTATPQDHKKASYAPMLDKKMGNIDWSMSAVDIERLIRGLNPWPSAYTYVNGKLLKIWEAEVVASDHEIEKGCVTDIQSKGFVVACGKDSLFIKEVQLQGKKRMGAGDFLRGNALEVNMFLTQVPQSKENH